MTSGSESLSGKVALDPVVGRHRTANRTIWAIAADAGGATGCWQARGYTAPVTLSFPCGIVNTQRKVLYSVANIEGRDHRC